MKTSGMLEMIANCILWFPKLKNIILLILINETNNKNIIEATFENDEGCVTTLVARGMYLKNLKFKKSPKDKK